MITAPPHPATRAGIRAFYLTGIGLDEYRPERPLSPEVPGLEPPPANPYPLLVEAGGGLRPLRDALGGIAGSGTILAVIRRAIASRGWIAAEDAAKTVDLADADGESRTRAKALLKDAVALVGFHAGAIPLLYGAALAGARKGAREAYLREIEGGLRSLDELLGADARHSPGAQKEKPLAAALGPAAYAYLDAAALARAFEKKHEAGKKLSPERRQRIEDARGTLDDAARRLPDQSLFCLFVPPALTTATLFGGMATPAAAPLEESIEFLQNQLTWLGAIERALRIARLETESAYDAGLHERALANIDWRSAGRKGLNAIPSVVVFEPSPRLAHLSLDKLSPVLRRGLPLHILVAGPELDVQAQGEAELDLAAITIAHREAFAAQAPMSRPDALRRCLEAMAQTDGPAVAVVPAPAGGQDEAAAWKFGAMYEKTGAAPAYLYDPARGKTLPERLELLSAPESVKTPRPTPAHAAALCPGLLHHFRVIPEASWNDEQIELEVYSKENGGGSRQGVPYLWVQGDDGSRRRAVISRDLATLCRERTAGACWTSALTEPPPAGKPIAEDAHGQHAEGARKAIERVVSLLTGAPAGATLPERNAVAPPAQPAPAPAPAEPVAAPAAPAPKPAAATAPSAPVETAPVAQQAAPDPYIDSFLCTSCNDCRKINPRMFGYDTNQQAYIADAAAGTFAELVKAAEGCPARCIHPGTPRAGDRTATPAMIARAAKFQ